MKNLFLTILVFLVGLIGATLSLMQIYASVDNTPYPLNASIEYLATAIFIFSFLFNLDYNTPIILKWINILTSLIFAGWGLIMSLICLYASPIENQSFPLASALFFTSTMIVGSGIFFMLKNVRL